MLKKIISCLAVIGTIFVINYKSMVSNHDYFAIICGDDNICEGDKRPKFCDTIMCVQAAVDKFGYNNIESIFKITYSEDYAEVSQVKITHKVVVEDE